MRIYLVRHGQTSWNSSGRAQGHTDVPLDPEGLDQARKLGWAFEGVPVDRVLTSDLVRSTETAEPLAKAVGVRYEARSDLRERSFGEWEGQMFTDLAWQIRDRATAAGVSTLEIRPPGGESFMDVWQRLDPVYDLLRQSDDTFAVVSHGGALALLLAKLVRGTLHTSRAFRFANTGITELERRPEGLFQINRYSDSSHLGAAEVLSGSTDGISR